MASSDRDGQLSLHNQSVFIGCGNTETHNAAWRSRLRKEGGGRKGKKKGRRKRGMNWVGKSSNCSLQPVLVVLEVLCWLSMGCGRQVICG